MQEIALKGGRYTPFRAFSYKNQQNGKDTRFTATMVGTTTSL